MLKARYLRIGYFDFSLCWPHYSFIIYYLELYLALQKSLVFCAVLDNHLIELVMVIKLVGLTERFVLNPWDFRCFFTHLNGLVSVSVYFINEGSLSVNLSTPTNSTFSIIINNSLSNWMQLIELTLTWKYYCTKATTIWYLIIYSLVRPWSSWSHFPGGHSHSPMLIIVYYYYELKVSNIVLKYVYESARYWSVAICICCAGGLAPIMSQLKLQHIDCHVSS